MKHGHFADHWNDTNGNPAGGVSTGRGFTISWQNGPLGRGAERKEPNGAFVEDVIQAVIGRINFYQDSRFNSADNAEALTHLHAAAEALDRRTREREARAVEGTHTA
jgi:hypothetical protein